MISKKIRLYPDKEQTQFFWQYAGTVRFVWNESLAFWNTVYEQTGKSPTKADMRHHLVELSKEEGYGWIAKCPEAARKRKISQLKKAFAEYFKGKRGRPKFHKKKSTCSFFQRTDRPLVKDKHHIKLTNIPGLVFVKYTKLPEKMYNAHISFDGKYWYLSYSYKVENSFCPAENQGIVGMDVGIKDMGITSDGVIYENPNKLQSIKRLEYRKKLLQRRLMRKPTAKQKRNCSRNVLKLRGKIALIDRKIANIRQNARHNMTKDMMSYSEIHVEDLNVSGMLKNRHLSKAVSGVGFFEIRRQLEYKSNLYSRKVVFADRFYPSSQLCSACGTQNKQIRGFENLNVREWTCPVCGTHHNRDINAAKNLALWNPA